MPPTSSDDLVVLIQSLILQCRADLDFLPLTHRVREVALASSGTWTGSRSADTWQLTEDGAQTTDETSGPVQALVAVCDALLAGVTSPMASADALDAWLADALPDSERYELGSLLGKGGMGEIRAAQDRRLGRAVALKVLSRPGTRRTSRFLGEARLTAALEHPGIVPVHDLGTTTDGRPYFAMKQVKGRSLAEVIEAGDPGTLAERLDVVRKVCDAVAFAHSNGILHRDLKPANVMVGAFGEVLVMDWGLATREGDVARVVAGTPAYMAPEQARGTANLDARVDVYALGAVLFELLVGRPAFAGTDREEVLRRVRSGDFPHPRQVDPSVPRELEELVVRCMALHREDRLADVSELKAELTRFLDGDDLHCVTYTPAERVRRFMDRRWRAAATFRWVAGALLVVLALSSAWYTADILRQRRRTLAELATAQLAIGDAALQRGEAAAARERYREAAATYQAASLPTWQSDLALGDTWHRFPGPLHIPLVSGRPTALSLSSDGSLVLVCASTEAVQATVFGRPVARVSYPDLGCDVATLDDSLVVVHRQDDSWVVRSLDPPRELVQVEARPDEHPRLGPTHLHLWRKGSAPRSISLHTGEEEEVPLRSLSDDGPWWNQRLSPHGRFQIAADAHDETRGVQVWERADPAAESKSFSGQVFFHHDTWLLEAWQSGLARWDAAPPGSPGPLWRLAWRNTTDPMVLSGLSVDHQWVWALGYDGSLLISSATSGNPVVTHPLPPVRSPSSVHAGSGTVVVAGRDGSIDVYFALGRSTLSAVPLHADLMYDVELTADARLAVVATGGGNGPHVGGVELVDLRARRRLKRWDLSNRGTRSISLSPDQRRVAAAGRDGTVQVLDLVTGAVEPPLETTLGKALALEWIEGDTLIVGGEPIGDDGEDATLPSIVRIDLLTRQVDTAARPFPHAIWDLDVSADGDRVAVTQSSGTLAVLDAQTLRTVASVEPGQGRSYGVALSADGGMVAAGTGNGSLVAWWHRTGEVSVTKSDSGPTMGVEPHPSRPWVFTTGFDGMLQAWDVSERGRSPRLLRRWWPEGGPEAPQGAGLGLGVARDTELTAWVGAFEEVRPVPLGEPADLDTPAAQLVHRRAWESLVQLLAADPGSDPAALATAWLALGEDRRAAQTLRDHPLPEGHADRAWADIVLGALATGR